MERKGHRSSAVRTYQRQSDQQLVEVSRALEPPRKSLWQNRNAGKKNAITKEPEDARKRNSAIVLAGKENGQIPMSEKIIHLKNCSVPTQEPKNAKDRNNVITFKYIISVSSRNNLSHCIKFKYVYKYKQ